MSQNDFTIANQGFPAFRADLNSALQALASNNSGATEPSTMFANMWWYDSANNIMYIRNEDNDAWIKFAELDQANDKFVLSGTLQLDDGTVSAPALTFNSDTNMGIYRGGTDILKFVTAGTDAITIDASQQTTFAGNIDVTGTATMDGLTVDGNALIRAATGSGTLNIVSSANVANAGNKIAFFGANRFEADEEMAFIQPLLVSNNGGSGNVQSGHLTFGTSGSEVCRIDSSGNIGIGMTSPSKTLDVDGQLRIRNGGATGYGLLEYGASATATNNWHVGSEGDGSFRFYNGNLGSGTERMRIGSGNLLVGATSYDSANDGFGMSSTGGPMYATATAQRVAIFNRRSSDGEIISLRKDGTVVATIGAEGGQAYIVNGDTGLKFAPSVDAIIPVNAGGANRDNAIDLGASSVRFDDIYATNGTIQTSDQNEKNTITDSDLGIDFIKRLTPKSYIFNGKTRTHYGLIAQDVETVLTDINKLTSGFAGFIKSDISEEQDGSQYRYGLRYGEFVAPLIQAVKDQQATIDALTARITALENGE